MAAVQRDPAAEPLLRLFILGRDAGLPDLGAAGRGESRHPAAGIERKDLAVGDQRHGAQPSARRRAGSGIGRPYLCTAGRPRRDGRDCWTETPPGSVHDALACGGGSDTGRPASAGSSVNHARVGDDRQCARRAAWLHPCETDSRASVGARSIGRSRRSRQGSRTRPPRARQRSGGCHFPVSDPSATSSHPSGSRTISTWC